MNLKPQSANQLVVMSYGWGFLGGVILVNCCHFHVNDKILRHLVTPQ